MIIEDTNFELVAPTTINIVCFRYKPTELADAALEALNTEIMIRLQESGTAAVSDTTVKGRHCLRAALCNHRTRRSDLRLLLQEIKSVGSEVLENG